MCRQQDGLQNPSACVCSRGEEKDWGGGGRERIRILSAQHLQSGLSLIKDIWVLLRRTGRGGGQWSTIDSSRKQGCLSTGIGSSGHRMDLTWVKESQVCRQWPRTGSLSMPKHTYYTCINGNANVINVRAISVFLLKCITVFLQELQM